jgi:enamine deaminase RidA (YjgF/YER057c/UK114 family)
MQRKAVNPWDWSLKLGYNQGELILGAGRWLVCAGQTAVDGEGRPCHDGDARGQVVLVLDNLEAVLREAGMALADVVSLRVYATDVDAVLAAFDVLGRRFGAAGAAPAMTLIGVTRLALPGLMVEIEAQAVA